MAITIPNLSTGDRKFLERFTCLKRDCDEHFKITTTEFDLTRAENNAKIYSASCARCGKFIQLTAGQLARWQRIFPKTDVEKVQSNFDKFFE